MRYGIKGGMWWVPILAMVLVALTGWWCDSEVRRVLEGQLEDKLASAIDANVTSMEIWIANQLRLVEMLALEDDIRAGIAAVAAHAASEGTEARVLARSGEAQWLHGRIHPLLKTWQERIRRDFVLGWLRSGDADPSGRRTDKPSRMGYVVIDPRGTIIAAPVAELLGDQLEEEAWARCRFLFDTGEPVLLIPYKPPVSRWRLFTSLLNTLAPVLLPPLQAPRLPPYPDGRERHSEQLSEARREAPDPDGRAGRGERGPPGTAPRAIQGRRQGGPLPGAGGRGGYAVEGRRNRSIMAVAAPVRSGQGKVVAALGLILNPADEFSKILSVNPGESGETFAFDGNGLLLSQSRFEKDLKEWGLLEEGPSGDQSSVLNLVLRDPGGDLSRGFVPEDPQESWPLLPLVARAVSGRAGSNIRGFRDYRGVPVVGAWRWLDDYGFGVATKLDREEAYQPLRVLDLVFLILLLVSALCGLALFLYSRINAILHRKMEEATLQARKLGQYTLKRKIGEGGMGAVYQASHVLLRRDTAIKLLPPGLASDRSVQRFEREVQLTSQLVHPNTIRIYDYGRTPEGIFFYAMEYLDGITLRELVDREGALPQGRVVHILEQVCASLSEAHAAGLVHRDIKPANVILCDRGGLADMAKVLDFGLVKSFLDASEARAEPTETMTMTITGTPHFMPPEAVRDPESVGPRSDLYLVGALGYYLVTGRHVFEGKTTFDIIRKHASEEPVPPRDLPDMAVDEGLERLILDCLRKDPAGRPQSAEDLRRALLGLPVHGDWTESLRRDWWIRWRTEREGAEGTSPDPHAESTLRINLAERVRSFRTP